MSSNGKPYSGPSKNKIDNLNMKGLASQQEKNFINATGQNMMLPVANGYYYQTGIVIDVIDNPKRYFRSTRNRIRVDNFLSEDDRNFNFLEKIPENSILCQIIDKGVNEYKSPNVCFPFFPSHIALPIKPGEHVWIMTEVTGDVERHYWVARKHSAFHVENLNYTHHEREFDIYRSTNELIKNTGKTEKAKKARLKYMDFPQLAKSGKLSLDPFDIQKNRGFDNLTVEPVPGIQKKPGDLLLQGSNNTLLHLTTEKFTNEKIQQQVHPLNSFSGKEVRSSKRTPFSPAIDICVARKKNELLELKETIANNKGKDDFIQTTSGIGFIKNNNINSNLQSYEVNKLAFVEEATGLRDISGITNDLDNSIKNCGSRIYLSNNCDIDNLFQIGKIEDKQADFEKVEPGAVFSAYSDNIRLVSDNTFRVVNNFTVEEEGKEKTGSTYIEIDKTGKVKIGSLDKNFPTITDGKNLEEDTPSGMQPFVKGDELQKLLERLIKQIQDILTILDNAFSVDNGANSTAGYGMANLGNVVAAFELMEIPGESGNSPFNELTQIKTELSRFKSTLIQGE